MLEANTPIRPFKNACCMDGNKCLASLALKFAMIASRTPGGTPRGRHWAAVTATKHNNLGYQSHTPRADHLIQSHVDIILFLGCSSRFWWRQMAGERFERVPRMAPQRSGDDHGIFLAIFGQWLQTTLKFLRNCKKRQYLHFNRSRGYDRII